MGKAAREQRRLQDQAQIAHDLSMLQVRPFILAGMEVRSVNMMTQLGKTPAVEVIFHMQNGDVHQPIVMDPPTVINLIAAITTNLLGGGGSGVSTEPEPEPEPTVTGSGLIIPGVQQ